MSIECIVFINDQEKLQSREFAVLVRYSEEAKVFIKESREATVLAKMSREATVLINGRQVNTGATVFIREM